jgi:hypothetical protein
VLLTGDGSDRVVARGFVELPTYAVGSSTKPFGWLGHAATMALERAGCQRKWRDCRDRVAIRYAVAGSGVAKTLTGVVSRSSSGTTIDSGRAGALEGRWPRRRSWLQTT